MQTISITDHLYPALLKEISHPPASLYVAGDPDLLQKTHKEEKPIVALVGTRRPTRYGLDAAFALARDLASRGAVIVSGLALGIDSAVHRGALAGKGITWAVLGSGLSNIYPATNRSLSEHIIMSGGLLISEFSPEQKPAKFTFPQRNRIIAGLSHATIVVEAPDKSGALITARFALDANREVGALPGEITSLNSSGTNALIKEGAALIRHADDVLDLIGKKDFSLVDDKLGVDNKSELENYILHYLDTPSSAESLAVFVHCAPDELRRTLTMLELRGAVQQNRGIFYKI